MTKNELLRLPPDAFLQIYTESGLNQSAFCAKFQISNTAFTRRAGLITAEQKMKHSVSETPMQNELMGISRKELLALPADRFTALFKDSGLTRMEFAAFKQISLNTVKNRLKEARIAASGEGTLSITETEQKVEIVTIDLNDQKVDTVPGNVPETRDTGCDNSAVRLIFRGIPLTIMNDAREQTLRSVFHILQEVRY